MYRAAAKAAVLLRCAPDTVIHRNVRVLSPLLQAAVGSPRFSTSVDSHRSPPHQSPNKHQSHQHAGPETPYYVDSTGSPSAAAAAASASSSSSGPTSSTAEEARRCHRNSPLADYQEEQRRVLQASLRHVKTLGWSEAALIAGAKDVGLSPSIVGSFPRKGAALVEYFMDDCLQRLIDRIDSGDELNGLIPSERISRVIRIRLEMQVPYISKWAEALAIQAQPLNVPTSLKQRAMLVDEICHAAGDDSSEVDWYVKRTVVGGIYSTSEVYMLTDSSPEFRDTQAFVDNRVKDAFDLKKTFQEATHLAEAVGEGVGRSLQGFVRGVMQR
ncbi:ubiquinone biosynthesis protein COQ9-B, mitochondrial [Rhodamnia argentea]|uniref:Ubiquinone biosynthesis protein n=1 Tax=Rhodamnia argentea TaxID=178133 RepID=A0A8B8P9P7_9MYRT|nr:ubiquinone biosynthesis protein COQ9-B, mitochondrial [Rhodamnia argentea]